MNIYLNEDTKRDIFYNKILQLVDPSLALEDIMINNTDGVLNGNILEFKNSISDLNEVLFQAIKYLSRMRVNGESVPANILLISLDQEIAYLYKSENYLKEVETIYYTSASVDNVGFIGKSPNKVLNYGNSDIDLYKLRDLLRENNYTKINIDEHSVVGWSLRYYEELPNASKIGFLGETSGEVKVTGEIRNPEHFKELIYPYTEKTNIKFDMICDKLNDNFQKKDLGAFYTPPLYSKKSHDLVYEAIRRHQRSGNQDYVILDFCAGTGNLQIDLNKDVPDDIEDKDILSHCILSTYEYIEWHILRKKLQHKVRAIIPAIEQPDTFVNGLVRGNDALSKEFLNNELIKSYIDDPSTTVIVFENPPYAEASGFENQKEGRGSKAGGWKEEEAVIEAKKVLKGAQSNDMANVFIWRALNYYLRKPEDSLILFSPLKYWKNAEWFNKRFIDGFAFNRRHFHTRSDTVVSCVLWANEEENLESFDLKVFDIEPYKGKQEEKKLIDMNRAVKVERVYSTFADNYYDKRIFNNDVIYSKDNSTSKNKEAIWFSINGEERTNGRGIRVDSYYNDNIVGYLTAQSNLFDNPRSKTTLIRGTQYNGNGFHLRRDNFHTKLPMFATGWWSTYSNDWALDGVIYKTSDGHIEYNKAVNSGELDNWLGKVAFYTALEYYNKIRSLEGSDGRLYINELCLDEVCSYNSEGELISKRNTLLKERLQELGFTLGKDEKRLLELWHNILNEAQKTKGYNKIYTYNPYQIETELNTFKRVRVGSRLKRVYDYPILNGQLRSLRTLIREYYNNHLVEKMFKYQFLK